MVEPGGRPRGSELSAGGLASMRASAPPATGPPNSMSVREGLREPKGGGAYSSSSTDPLLPPLLEAPGGAGLLDTSRGVGVVACLRAGDLPLSCTVVALQ